MKKLFLLFFLIFSIAGKSQNSFEWVKLIKSQLGNVECKEIVTDEQGNLYVCGGFEAQALFDTITRNSNGGFDLFIAKLDPNGNFIWAKTAGGNFDDKWNDIEYYDGHLYTTGYFSFQLQIGDSTFTNIGSTEFITAKFDTSGNLKWAKTGGSVSSTFPFIGDEGFSIERNSFNEIYVGGRVNSGIATFGDTTFLNQFSSRNILIRYDTSGEFIDVFQTPGFVNNLDVEVDGFDRIVLPFSNFTSNPSTNYFLTSVWSRNYTFQQSSINSSFANDYAFEVTSNSNQYVGVEFQGQQFAFHNTAFASSGGTDFLLTRLDENSQLKWIKQFGGGGNDRIQDIKSDSTGIYLSGFFNTSATFDTTIVTSFGQSFFIAKLDTNGNLIWSSTGGNGVGVTGNGIAVISPEEVAIAGDFLSQLVVDGIGYNGLGFRDGFIAKRGCRPAQPNKIFGDTSVCFDTSKFYVEFNQGVLHSWQLDSGGTLLNNTGDTVFVVWNKSGNSTLTVTPINNCGNGSERKLGVKVKAKPVIPIISGDTAICLGSHQFIVNNPESALYSWQNKGSAVKINLGINVLYTWSTPQQDTLILTATNSCGSTSSVPLIVDVASTPTQAPTIQGSTTACTGTSVFTLQNKIMGETYVWNSPGAQVTTNQDSAFINFPSSGNYSISAYAQNQCGNGPSGLLTVVVDDVPNQPFGFSGDLTPCVGVENYSINPQFNTTYSWSIDSGGAIIPLGNSASVLWNKKGNYNISITPSNQCGIGSSIVKSVTVNAIPNTPNSIAGEDTVCLGSQQYLANLSEGTPIWSLSGGGALNSNGSVSTINWVSPGNYILNVSATNACGTSNTKSKVISVDTISNALSVINGNAQACADTTSYSVTFQSGQSYVWELDSGGILIDSLNSAQVVWQKEGFFNLKVSTGNGCKTSKVIEVIGLPDTIISFTGNSIVCSGTNAYSFTPEAGINYSWQSLNGGNITALGSSAFVSWNNAQSDTLEVMGSNQCGAKKVVSFPVSVNQTPVLTNLTGDSLICQNSTVNYLTNSDSSWSFTWQTSSGVLSSSAENATINWIDTGTFVVQVNASNFCGISNTISKPIVVLGQPKPPAQLFGNPNPCNETTKYFINRQPNQTYQWILGVGGQITANNDSAIITWTQKGANNIAIIPQSICGSGIPASFNILVNDVPSQPTYTANNILCKGIASFSATSSNADSLHWFSPNLLGFDTVGFGFNWSLPDTGVYDLAIIPKNVCGFGDTLLKSITIIDVKTPEVIIGDSTSCLNLSSYSTNFDTAQTFLWSLAGGGILNTNQNTATIQWLGQGIFGVDLRIQNKCGIGPKLTKTITVSDVPTIPLLTIGDSLPCVGNSVFETPFLPNTKYNWQFDTLSFLDTTNSISINLQPQDTLPFLLYSQNQCGLSDSLSFTLKAIDKPVLNSPVIGDSVLCFGAPKTYYVGHTGDLLNWSTNGGAFLIPQGDTVIVSPTTLGIFNLTVSTWNKCGAGEKDTLSIEINDVPNQPGNFTGALKTCQTNVDSFFAFAPGATNLNWLLSGGGNVSGNLAGAQVNWTNSGTFLLEATPTNLCGIGPKRSALIEVLEKPDAPKLIGGDTIVCLGNEAYTVSSNIKANYFWKTDTGISILPVGNSAQIDWKKTGNFNLKIISTNFCGIGDSSKFNVIVQDIPNIPIGIIGKDSVCLGTNVQFAADTQMASYQWSLPSGGSITSFNDSVKINWSTPGGHQLSLIAQNSCGQSQSLTKIIHVDGFPQPPNFSLIKTKACIGEPFEAFAIPNFGSQLKWFVEDGNFTLVKDSIIVKWSTTGEKVLSAFEENKCGSSAPVSYVIQVNDIPFISGNIIGEDTVCVNTLASYQIPLSTLTSYTWNISEKANYSVVNNFASISWDSAFTDTILISASNYCGTSNNVPFTVNIKDNPITPTITMNNDTLFAMAEKGNIQWYLEDIPINGANNNWFVPQQQGYYRVSVANVCEEEILSERVLFGYNTSTAGIRIYPNPTAKFVSVAIPINLNWENIEVINPIGQTIQLIENTGLNLNILDLTFIPAGIYTLRVKTEFGLKSIRLIKA